MALVLGFVGFLGRTAPSRIDWAVLGSFPCQRTRFNDRGQSRLTDRAAARSTEATANHRVGTAGWGSSLFLCLLQRSAVPAIVTMRWSVFARSKEQPMGQQWEKPVRIGVIGLGPRRSFLLL
ncbi:MAG: hypothetical protein A2V98_04720 [Planctomycetes bacterium RBG_16_64_12]|nr:MAG: hypothetical protein A2V98_04720 [Planctomycetes bacterium RBG_16_64_12]